VLCMGEREAPISDTPRRPASAGSAVVPAGTGKRPGPSRALPNSHPISRPQSPNRPEIAYSGPEIAHPGPTGSGIKVAAITIAHPDYQTDRRTHRTISKKMEKFLIQS
jgi:hypothetical protein